MRDAPLCILAGSGRLPRYIAAQCRLRGEAYTVLALEGAVDRDWLDEVPHRVVPLGKIVTALGKLRSRGVARIVLAGGIQRPKWRDWKPDRRTALTAARIFAWGGQGDDRLLRALIKELEAMGFTVLAPQSLEPGLLAEKKTYGRRQPSSQERRAIRLGVGAARTLGSLDIGQAVIVDPRRIIGVEGVEGTDALIDRCAELSDHAILVKTRKPGQEQRVDLPCVGEGTVRHCVQARLRGIAVEAGGTWMLDRAAMTALADRHDLFLVGIPVG